ncbi:MAG: TetR/AcrR family transcriptional regulator [Acidimicrobiia bacterium]|nr:TetR/AcrR family transcriptional regulator [Acidimicrobiia bacterium]
MTTGRVAARRAATKDAILEAAWEIARSEGLGGVSMRPLAAALGMSAPSLYEYFAGKDAIYDAMYVQGNHALRERMQAITDLDRMSARESLVAGARAFVEFCNEDRARFQLLFQHSIPGWHPSEQAYAVAIENLELSRAHLESIGITHTRSLDLWTALVSGLASQQVANDPGGDRWLRLVEPAVDMFLSTEGGTK